MTIDLIYMQIMNACHTPWLLRLDLGARLAKIGQNVSTFLPHDHSETAGVLDLGLAPAPRDVFRLAGPGGPTVWWSRFCNANRVRPRRALENAQNVIIFSPRPQKVGQATAARKRF